MGYTLEGRLLESCSCNGPCPCWVGDDPDGGACDAFLAYHFDRGQINGVDFEIASAPTASGSSGM